MAVSTEIRDAIKNNYIAQLEIDQEKCVVQIENIEMVAKRIGKTDENDSKQIEQLKAAILKIGYSIDAYKESLSTNADKK